MVFKVHRKADLREVMQQHNLMTIDQMLTTAISTFMFRFHTGSLPSTFQGIFQTKSLSNHATRSNSELIPCCCRNNLTKQSIRYIGPVTWNKLPSELRNESKTINSFKAKLKVHALSGLGQN